MLGVYWAFKWQWERCWVCEEPSTPPHLPKYQLKVILLTTISEIISVKHLTKNIRDPLLILSFSPPSSSPLRWPTSAPSSHNLTGNWWSSLASYSLTSHSLGRGFRGIILICNIPFSFNVCSKNIPTHGIPVSLKALRNAPNEVSGIAAGETGGGGDRVTLLELAPGDGGVRSSEELDNFLFWDGVTIISRLLVGLGDAGHRMDTGLWLLALFFNLAVEFDSGVKDSVLDGREPEKRNLNNSGIYRLIITKR